MSELALSKEGPEVPADTACLWMLGDVIHLTFLLEASLFLYLIRLGKSQPPSQFDLRAPLQGGHDVQDHGICSARQMWRHPLTCRPGKVSHLASASSSTKWGCSLSKPQGVTFQSRTRLALLLYYLSWLDLFFIVLEEKGGKKEPLKKKQISLGPFLH